MAKSSDPLPRILTIPPEVREEIYRHLFTPSANRTTLAAEPARTTYNYRSVLGLLLTNRQIYLEARKIFHDLNIFVRIQTPWTAAQSHVSAEGHVPIVATGERAFRFPRPRLTVNITAPHVPLLDSENPPPECSFLILLDDLAKFTRVWFYADLTHPSLNNQLHLALHLRNFLPPDNNRAAYDDKTVPLPNAVPALPLSLQRRLLLPFGEVKNLGATRISGAPHAPLPAVLEELAALQKQPHQSPEHCLRECERLKAEGNAALNAGEYDAALERYTEAWAAIHIIVDDCDRHIHADKHFARNLTEAPYAGKNGQSERLVMRVTLVANTCQVYLKKRDFERCHYWGMRTIGMLREAMGFENAYAVHHGQAAAEAAVGDDGGNASGVAAAAAEWFDPEDEAIMGFPAADQMGKIYYRTAVASRELGDESDARRLLRVARVYLPNDRRVKQEIEETALRLG